MNKTHWSLNSFPTNTQSFYRYTIYTVNGPKTAKTDPGNNQKWQIHTSWFQNSTTIIKTMWYWNKDIHKNPMAYNKKTKAKKV